MKIRGMILLMIGTTIPFFGTLTAQDAAAPEKAFAPTPETEAVSGAVIEAWKSKDYDRIAPLLSQNLAKDLNEERFAAMVDGMKRFGTLEDARHVGVLRHPVAQSDLWILTYEKKNDAGVVMTTDKLLRILTGELDGRRIVIGLLVQ